MTTYAQAMTRDNEFGGGAATTAVAAMSAALFAGSTVLTPLYVIYKQAFGFSQMTLTLVYAVYVVGNLAALLVFGRLSDAIGRRPAALARWRPPLSVRWSSCSPKMSPGSISPAS
ncbi:hypothetical protein [Mesorhizobium sp.]|uniref:hypothetical protein n=1 Tax=Mesorhizobium sp. TaxID=1871066 RepID=UPI0025C56A54|nr:hypothetical protein [Mesorhizobium sp.]